MARLTELTVNFLSLVKKPANGKKLTLKAEGGLTPHQFALSKSDNDRMVAYGIVYSVEEMDLDGDFADEVTVRRAAYEFMREGRLKNIDTEHSFDPKYAYVCESWLVRAGDELFPDEPAGSWAVGIQIIDPDLWRELKEGKMTGISMAGYAREELGRVNVMH